jgi:hypothetical protein
MPTRQYSGSLREAVRKRAPHLTVYSARYARQTAQLHFVPALF